MDAGGPIWRTNHLGIKGSVVSRHLLLRLILACNCIDLVEPVLLVFETTETRLMIGLCGRDFIAKTNMASMLKTKMIITMKKMNAKSKV